MPKIAIVVGSLRKESYNRRLAQAIASMDSGDVEWVWPDVGSLPLYDQDDDADPAMPVVEFKEQVLGAEGVIFVTPEYNRSIPGVLKNAIDHASRPPGKSVWKGKAAGIIGISPGKIGTALAQQHLRNVLAALDMPTLNQPEAFLQFEKDKTFADDGSLSDSTAGFVRKWLDRYLDLIAKHRG